MAWITFGAKTVWIIIMFRKFDKNTAYFFWSLCCIILMIRINWAALYIKTIYGFVIRLITWGCICEKHYDIVGNGIGRSCWVFLIRSDSEIFISGKSYVSNTKQYFPTLSESKPALRSVSVVIVCHKGVLTVTWYHQLISFNCTPPSIDRFTTKVRGNTTLVNSSLAEWC